MELVCCLVFRLGQQQSRQPAVLHQASDPPLRGTQAAKRRGVLDA